MSKYTEGEQLFLQQLVGLGWLSVDQNQGLGVRHA